MKTLKPILLSIIGISIISFSFNSSYAVSFEDSTGYQPTWAGASTQDEVIDICLTFDESEQNIDWCLEYLDSLINQIQEEIEQTEDDEKETIADPEPDPETDPEPIMDLEPKSLGIASFVDESKDPQSYVDRYNSEPKYKEWFDTNYPQYESIYQAVGVDEPTVSKSETSQTNTEPNCGAGTIPQNGICVIDKSQTTESKSSGGCLIATATFDSELAPQVQKLREIRDSKLLSTESGTKFMESFNSFYYSFSPIIADYERENLVFKEAVKIGITPMLSTLSLMDYADTESEVLGIGISLIILNAMMYVGLPVFGIMIAKKRF